MIRIIGPADKIIGALILDEYLSPKIRQEIVKVIPINERSIRSFHFYVFIHQRKKHESGGVKTQKNKSEWGNVH